MIQVLEHKQLTKVQADKLTAKIKKQLGDVMLLILKAYAGRVWAVEGSPYESWDEWVSGEFDYAPFFVSDKKTRKAVVEVFRANGMSTRAIAAPLGVTNATVSRDLDSGVTNVTRETENQQVTGIDGKNYSKKRAAAPDLEVLPNPFDSDEIVAEVVEEQPAATADGRGGQAAELEARNAELEARIAELEAQTAEQPSATRVYGGFFRFDDAMPATAGEAHTISDAIIDRWGSMAFFTKAVKAGAAQSAARCYSPLGNDPLGQPGSPERKKAEEAAEAACGPIDAALEKSHIANLKARDPEAHALYVKAAAAEKKRLAS